MKKKFLSLLLLFCVVIGSAFGFTACGDESGNTSSTDSTSTKPEPIDYAGQVRLDMNSETLKQEVTVENYIDGDTTHFKVPTSIVDTGLLKARYLAVNTPESTGKLEEWGKKASNYTKNTLKSASSIILETNGTEWEKDTTGERYLVWVWYKTAEMPEYRCLNIELLQQGLAVGSKAGSTRYGEICVAAINRASEMELHVHSDEKDPDFFYGAAYEIDLKELRLNLEYYKNKRVAFEGTVTQYNNQGVYVENYDEEAEAYYGIYVYYGFFLDTYGQAVLEEGNRVRIVGNLQYYETGDSWQVSDLKYNRRKPDDPDNIKLISKGNTIPEKLITAETFNSKLRVSMMKLDADGNLVLDENEEPIEVFKDVPYAEVALNTTMSMKQLYVKDVYTTNNDGNNDGAMTLTCTVGNQTIIVRTMKIYHEDNTLVVESELKGKTISIKGIVDEFGGQYQIKVFAFEDITFEN